MTLDEFTKAVRAAELMKLITTRHAPLNGDDFAWLLQTCEAVAVQRGFEIVEGSPPNDGLVDLDARWIALAPNPPNHQTKALLHELAHVVEETYTRRALRGPPSLFAASEVYAETTAHLVGKGFGLDTSAVSVPYVAFYDVVGNALAQTRVRSKIVRAVEALSTQIRITLRGP